jgi:hypothetical protein
MVSPVSVPKLVGLMAELEPVRRSSGLDRILEETKSGETAVGSSF